MIKSVTKSKKHIVSKQYNNSFLSLFLLNNMQDNLKKIENYFSIVVYNKGDIYKIEASNKKNINRTIELLDTLNTYLVNENLVKEDLLNTFLSGNLSIVDTNFNTSVIKTKRKTIPLKTKTQILYSNAIDNNKIIFATGPAGGGKTYLAVAKAVEYFLLGKTEKIIISRPIVETGESLGYLPGGMDDKVDPYLTPIKDALLDMIPNSFMEDMIKNNQFEIAPMDFMRGRTFKNSFIILDEAQNAALSQLKMLLTRLGENSTLVVTGDLSQIDLTSRSPSGLQQCIEIVKNISDIACVNFNTQDIVRSDLVKKIVSAFIRHNC